MEIDTIETPLGDGRLFISAAADPLGTIMLGHGAGGGVDAPDLKALADRLPALGLTVIRFEQPWRTAGNKVAVLPPKLDVGWHAAVESLAGRDAVLGSRLFFGGRSAGARVACRTAPAFMAGSPGAESTPPVVGVVCLSFPLHPPGRPEKSRAPELLGAGVPRLVLQGQNDAFGGPEDIRAAAPGPDIELVPVPNADHSLKVAKASPFTARDVLDLVVGRVSRFCLDGSVRE